MILTDYQEERAEKIIQLFENVFSASEGPDEGAVIGALVREMIETTSPEALKGFIAKEGEKIIGAIFFSRFSLPSQKNAYILSPVAVSTLHQGTGVGQQLIRFGISALQSEGVEILLTYGDPNYYCKTGFKPISEALIPAPLKLSMPQGWLAQSLTEHEISPETGQTQCVAALNNQALW
ncbi:GNAT family N-acetyltransferase [uncultured Neptuniibacter sp.]|uniref:GNAT family N-acetyltransferase n=1 Tax=uncultured Neptuniibacter sp. TaxID=502143 RepID=UPI0026099145|nr:N-acetyltransferase [uncultured Neptuniibacter sp.]